MQFPCDSFRAIKCGYQYLLKDEINLTGIYFQPEKEVFDCWFVSDKNERILVCSIPEKIIDDDVTMFSKANKVLQDFSIRFSAR